MQTAMVTGGAGFIGSHLCKRLVSDGIMVVCVDDYSTGLPENLAGLRNESRFDAVCRDVCDPLPFVQTDYIYHLASPASPVDYQRRPVDTLRTCVLGSMNALELARQTGARVLLASTSEVYGDPAVQPQPESYWGNVNPIGVRSCYDEGKRCAESFFANYRREYGVNTVIARLFNTYGPRMKADDGRVMSTFICQALSGLPLTVHGTGTQTRSFCYVEDIVEALVSLMASSEFGPMNLGGLDEISMAGLAEIIVRETRSSSVVQHVTQAEDDPQRRRPDVSLARARLGWKPRVSFQLGLRQTVSWLRTGVEGATCAA